MDLHATISLWQREEDGSYRASLEGYSLHVTWVAEQPNQRRGFRWKGDGPRGAIESVETEEEIEVAMALAEKAARKAALGHG